MGLKGVDARDYISVGNGSRYLPGMSSVTAYAGRNGRTLAAFIISVVSAHTVAEVNDSTILANTGAVRCGNGNSDRIGPCNTVVL